MTPRSSLPKSRLSRLVELSGDKSARFDAGFTDISFVPQYGLCTMCATCEGVCPHDAICMHLSPDKGIYEPVVDSALCTDCGLCVECCPGFGLDLPRERPVSQSGLSIQPLVGAYNGIYRAHSIQEAIRSGGASGGMVTSVLHYLFEQDLIDGAIVMRMDPDHPFDVLPYIAYEAADLFASQKSKYCPAPLNTILTSVLRGQVKATHLAYVGLPCHVEGLRLAQSRIPRLRKLFPFTLSLFCHGTPSRWATEYLMYKNGIEAADLREVVYRSGRQPSHLSFLLKDGREIQVPHLHWAYWGHAFMNFFCPARCWLCPDKTGEFADLSFGDNWQQWGVESAGESTVITRSVSAQELIEEMGQGGYISLHPMTVEQFVRDQDLTREGNITPRLKIWRLLGRSVPLYVNSVVLRKASSRDLYDSLRASFRIKLGEHHVSVSLLDQLIWSSWQWHKAKSLPSKLVRRSIGKFRSAAGKLLRRFRITNRGQRPSGQGTDTARISRPKIAIVGGYGWHDIGDEAMPRADVINLRKRLPDLDVVMLSPDPAYTTAYHGERSILDLYRYLYAAPPWPFNRLQGRRWWPVRSTVSQGFWMAVRWLVFLLAAFCRRVGVPLPLPRIARNILDELATADLLFNVGGGNINSVIRTELYQKTLAHLSAKALGIPAIISGQTIGPFFKQLDVFLARRALNAADMLTLRDKEVSRQRLVEIGVTGPCISDTADDAMTLPALPENQAQQLLSEWSEGQWTPVAIKFLVAMNMNGYALGMGRGNGAAWSHDVAVMAEVADRLVERCQAHVLLIPTDYGSGSDDRPLLQEVKSAMRHGEQALCAMPEVDDITLKGLIGLADLAIGSRYHFNVFAVSMGVPCIGVASGIYQMTKLDGLMALYGLPQCFVNKGLDSLSAEELWTTVERVLAEREQIVVRLQEMTPVLQERSLITIQRAVELLTKKKT